MANWPSNSLLAKQPKWVDVENFVQNCIKFNLDRTQSHANGRDSWTKWCYFGKLPLAKLTQAR